MRKQRIYIDISGVGGCLDGKFASESSALFEMARAGRAVFVISDVVLDELGNVWT